jgi:hypothetical protein
MVFSNSRWYVYTCNYAYALLEERLPKLVIIYDSPVYGEFDSYTKSLMHFDYTGDKLYFRDEIQNEWMPYCYNSGNPLSGSGASISLNQYKFGDASGYFGGNLIGDWIETPTNFEFGAQDFTAECFIWASEEPYTWGICGEHQDNNNFWAFRISGSAIGNRKMGFVLRSGGTTLINTVTWVLPDISDNWHHLACVKHGSQVTTFFDGVSYGTIDAIETIPTFTGAKFRIGNVGTVGYYKGYMDEFRLSIGIARWTSSFTPPTSPYAPEEPPEEGNILYGQPFMYSSYPWI